MYLIQAFDEDATKTSTIFACQAMALYLPGPILGVVSSTIGAHRAVILGAVVASIGYFLSAFCDSVLVLIFTHGLVVGIGSGLVIIPWTEIISSYFEDQKHRDSAVCFVQSSSGIGIFLCPPLTEFIIQWYGWRFGYMITAGITLQICILGCLSPLKTQAVFNDLKQAELEILIEEKKSKSSVLKSSFQMLCDWRFDLFLVSEILWCIGISAVLTIVPDVATRHGYSKRMSGLLLAAMGATSLTTRVILTILNLVFDNLNKYKYYLSPISAVFTSIIWSLFPISGTSLIGLFILCVLSEIFDGLKHGVVKPFLLHIYGIERVTLAIGNLSLAFGLGMAFGPLLGGFVMDATGSYDMAFYIIGGFSFVSSFLYIPIMISFKNGLTQKKDESDIES